MIGDLPDWRVLDLQADLHVRATGTMPVLPPETEATVARIWAQAVADNPRLFNGPIFSLDHAGPALLDGHWSEFRRMLAQIADPTLSPIIGQQPLATCGLLLCPDGAVLGQRQDDAVYQPGLWQFAPAGCVDRSAARDGGWVDWQAQFVTELTEELGLAGTDLEKVEPVCLVLHPGSGVADICLLARTPLSAAQILSAHAASHDDEYQQMHVVPLQQVARFVSDQGGSLAPQSRLFLNRMHPQSG